VRDLDPDTRRRLHLSAVVYAGLAALVVVIAWATGGDVQNAIVAAVVAYVLALAWTWWRAVR
jgi:hypothetical protein